MALLTRTDDAGAAGAVIGTMPATGEALTPPTPGLPGFFREQGVAPTPREVATVLGCVPLTQPGPARYATARGRCWRTS